MTFVQTGAAVPGTDGILYEVITCFGCQDKGHYKSKCTRVSDVQLLQIDHDTSEAGLEDIPEVSMEYDGSAGETCEPILEEVKECVSDNEDDVFVSF